jgi:hypothetical protein
MKILYEFWRLFLLDYFSPDMYDLFRSLTISDASCECGSATFGLTKLIAFYDDIRKKPLMHDLAGALGGHYDEAMEMSMAVSARGFGSAYQRIWTRLRER